MVAPTEDAIWAILDGLPDPEIPVISIVELGMVRNVSVAADGGVEVVISPTYTGCPAVRMIENDIVATLKDKGYGQVKVSQTLSPPWTTDWITEKAKEKLMDYGICPPPLSTEDKGALLGKPATVRCPHCKSIKTTLKSRFGSTPCKSLYVCDDCMEPFDYFKCL